MPYTTRILLRISLIILPIVIAVILLSKKKSSGKNGFARQFLPYKVEIKSSIDLSDGNYSILNLTEHAIILYNLKKPDHMIMFSYDLKDTTQKFLRSLPRNESLPGINTLRQSNEGFFLLNGGKSSILKFGVQGEYISLNKLNHSSFHHADMINSNAFLINTKTEASGIKRRTIKKVNWKGQEKARFMPDYQREGIFSTDGFFQYDDSSKRLFYLFSYRGEFVCLDTNLKTLYKRKTIDTVRHAQFQTAMLKESYNGREIDKMYLSKPPAVVNRAMCIANNNIYINSNLMSDNADPNILSRPQPIDIYNTANGQYKGSFSIPRFNHHKLTQFRIYHDTIVGIFQTHLVVLEMKKLP